MPSAAHPAVASPRRSGRGLLCGLLLSGLVLVLLAGPALAASVRAPAMAVPGSRFIVSATGFAPGSRLVLTLSPTIMRGGNCCGVQGARARANAKGRARFVFVFPRTYNFCAGAGHCTKTPWTRERADVVVETRLSGRDYSSYRRALRTTLVVPPA